MRNLSDPNWMGLHATHDNLTGHSKNFVRSKYCKFCNGLIPLGYGGRVICLKADCIRKNKIDRKGKTHVCDKILSSLEINSRCKTRVSDKYKYCYRHRRKG